MSSSWQNVLQEKTDELLGEFSLSFEQMLSLALFKKVQSCRGGESGGAAREALKLAGSRSTSESCAISNNTSASGDNTMMSSAGFAGGVVFSRQGDALGNFPAKWTEYFLAPQNDTQINNSVLQLFRSSKEWERPNSKPLIRLQLNDYQLVTNVAAHYNEAVTAICAELGAEAPKERFFSTYSWALSHNFKPNFQFQLHRAKMPAACKLCVGSETNEADLDAVGEQFEEAKNTEFVPIFEKMITQSTPQREMSNPLVSIVFDVSMENLKAKLNELRNFSDFSSELEILRHAVYLAVFEPHCRPNIVKHIVASAAASAATSGGGSNLNQNRLCHFIKARQQAMDCIERSAGKVWQALESKASGKLDKDEAMLEENYDDICQVKNQTRQIILETISSKLDNIIESSFVGAIDSSFDLLNKASNLLIKETVEQVKHVLCERVANETDEESREKLLSSYCISKNSSNNCGGSDAIKQLLQNIDEKIDEELSSILQQLKDLKISITMRYRKEKEEEEDKEEAAASDTTATNANNTENNDETKQPEVEAEDAEAEGETHKSEIQSSKSEFIEFTEEQKIEWNDIEIRDSLKELAVTLMDSACYTMQQRLASQQIDNFLTLATEIINDLNEDVAIHNNLWVKEQMNQPIQKLFYRASFSLSLEEEEMMKKITESIPDNFKAIIHADSEFVQVVGDYLSSMIEKKINERYPLPEPSAKTEDIVVEENNNETNEDDNQ